MCIFTNCLAQGAIYEQSGKGEEQLPGGPAGRVQGAKGCPLEQGSFSEGMKESCVKPEPKLTR